MPSNTVSAQQAREDLYNLFVSTLVGAGKEVQVAYKSMVPDFGGASPVLVVVSDPTDRTTPYKGGQTYHNEFDLAVWSYVILSATGWTSDNAEDRLNLIEKRVADVVMDHRGKAIDPTVHWDQLMRNGPTQPGVTIVGGKAYRREKIPIRARYPNA